MAKKRKWADWIKKGADVLLENADKKDDRRPDPRPRPEPRPKPKPPETPSPPPPPRLGTDIEILVAPRGSAAQEAAAARANDQTVFAERKLFRALNRAAEHLNGQGDCTVTVRLAAGDYTGKARTGTWLVPQIKAPGSTFRILGGYSDDWGQRDPFFQRTWLRVADDRNAPVFQLERESVLREFYLSGLTMDAGPGNSYGSGDNLQSGQSNSYELLAMSYLESERLIIADNTFANAGHRVAETLVRAASESAEIIVRNNLVLNSIMAWRAFSAKYKQQPGRYLIEHNSFILNWPHSPDRTTSNPGALEIGDKYSAGEVAICGNLFAFNVGGAIHPGSDDKEGPPMSIEDNLFWGNGSLFHVDRPGNAAVVGKFNRSRNYIPFDPIEIEDEFDWTVSGNVVEDPGLRVQVSPFEGYSSVREKKPPGAASVAAEAEPAVDEPSVSRSLDDVASQIDEMAAGADVTLEDDGLVLDVGDDSEAGGDDGGLVLDDLSLDDDLTLEGGDDLKLDDDLFEDLGFDDSWAEETYKPTGYARRLFLDAPEAPFPTTEVAKGFGASPDRVEQL